MLRSFFLLAGLFALCIPLAGCEDEEAHASAKAVSSQKVTQHIAPDLHQFSLPETPSEPKEEPVYTEAEHQLQKVKLPSEMPLKREQRARSLRGERHYRSATTSLKSPVTYEDVKEIQNTDLNYSSQGLSSDESTYPVDRSRMLTADMRISAILEDSINSQIPGRAIAVIDRDVLSATGKFILLPAYSKIICSYKTLDKQGQTRLSLKCSRIIRPDGVSIVLTEAQAADQMGRNGLVGEMDYRLWQRYGGAFLVSGISALAQAGSGMTRSRAVDEGVTNLSQNLAQITSQFLEESVDVKPVISIAAGSRIQIIPQNDISLKQPKIIKKRKKV